MGERSFECFRSGLGHQETDQGFLSPGVDVSSTMHTGVCKTPSILKSEYSQQENRPVLAQALAALLRKLYVSLAGLVQFTDLVMRQAF
jgi:hypothetical protein